MKPDALIVIDMQQALIDDHPYQEEKLLAQIGELIAACRKQQIPVIFVQHEDAEGNLQHGSDGWQIAAALAPRDGELRINKRFNSAFRQTDLQERLQAMNAHNLVMCGMQTEYCVDATCKVAFELGYQVTIPRDATSTYDNRLFKASDLLRFYQYYIWADRFAKIAPMEEVLADIAG